MTKCLVTDIQTYRERCFRLKLCCADLDRKPLFDGAGADGKFGLFRKFGLFGMFRFLTAKICYCGK